MTTAEYMRAYRANHKAGFGPIVACKCGCGARFRKFDGYNKQERRYLAGHNGRGRPRSAEARAKFSATIRKRNAE